MECPEVVERLWEYLDGELAAKEVAAINRHLARCPTCLPCCRCHRAFLELIVRSLAAPCQAPARLHLAVRTRMAAVPPL